MRVRDRGKLFYKPIEQRRRFTWDGAHYSQSLLAVATVRTRPVIPGVTTSCSFM